MKIEILNYDFSVCKLKDLSLVDMTDKFCFTGKTDDEISFVCITEAVPGNAISREDGWKALRIQGVLDFSLIGILAKISSVLAQNGIGIFVISTYNTDYILIKKENLDNAVKALSAAGYCFI